MWYALDVNSRITSTALLAAAVGLALSLTACSSLTKPEEITIAAEPLPSRGANAAPQGAAPTLQLPTLPTPPAAAPGTG